MFCHKSDKTCVAILDVVTKILKSFLHRLMCKTYKMSQLWGSTEVDFKPFSDSSSPQKNVLGNKVLNNSGSGSYGT